MDIFELMQGENLHAEDVFQLMKENMYFPKHGPDSDTADIQLLLAVCYFLVLENEELKKRIAKLEGDANE